MKKIQHLAVASLFAGTGAVYGQTPAKGDAAKGKAVFDQQCPLCRMLRAKTAPDEEKPNPRDRRKRLAVYWLGAGGQNGLGSEGPP
jgi:cytochrome c5